MNGWIRALNKEHEPRQANKNQHRSLDNAISGGGDENT